MTRRPVRSSDPTLDQTMALLPPETRQSLNALRLRLLLAPEAKKWLGKDPEPLSNQEREALDALQRALAQKEVCH